MTRHELADLLRQYADEIESGAEPADVRYDTLEDGVTVSADATDYEAACVDYEHVVREYADARSMNGGRWTPHRDQDFRAITLRISLPVRNVGWECDAALIDDAP